jgi:hypothetical protein
MRAQQLLTAGSYYSTFVVESANKSNAFEEQSRLLELTLCSPTGLATGSMHGDQHRHSNFNVDCQSQERLLKSTSARHHSTQTSEDT